VVLKVNVGALEVSFKNNWNKPIHRWYHFHAGCSSEFPEKIIDLLQIDKNCTILDPFAGSGTILISAKEREIHSVGFDLNPFYIFLAGVKTYWEFDMEYLFEFMNNFMVDVKNLFNKKVICSCEDKNGVKVDNIPQYIWRYFNPEELEELSIIKKKVSEIKSEHIREFLLFALASILIEVSKVHYVGETIVFDREPKKSISVYDAYVQKVRMMYSDLKAKQKIINRGNVMVKKGDIRDLLNLIPNKTVDHVITHPPYLNNYNYLLHDRLPLYFLDYFKTPNDEKKMRDLIIGSVTKNKISMEFSLDIPAMQEIAKKIKATGDLERYKAFLEYFDSMSFFLEKLHDKIKRNGYCAMLVGNSYVRGVMVPLDVIIADVAERAGFEVLGISKVRDRGKGAFQHLYNGNLYESVVLLKIT